MEKAHVEQTLDNVRNFTHRCRYNGAVWMNRFLFDNIVSIGYLPTKSNVKLSSVESETSKRDFWRREGG